MRDAIERRTCVVAFTDTEEFDCEDHSASATACATFGDAMNEAIGRGVDESQCGRPTDVFALAAQAVWRQQCAGPD